MLTEHNCTKYQYKSCQLSATLLLNQHSFANYCHVLSLLLSQVLSLSTTIALHYGASKRKQQGQRCICMFRFVCPMWMCVSMRLYICVSPPPCVPVCLCLCVYICVFMPVCLCLCISVSVFPRLPMCLCVYACVSMPVCLCLCVYVCVYKWVCLSTNGSQNSFSQQRTEGGTPAIYWQNRNKNKLPKKVWTCLAAVDKKVSDKIRRNW